MQQLIDKYQKQRAREDYAGPSGASLLIALANGTFVPLDDLLKESQEAARGSEGDEGKNHKAKDGRKSVQDDARPRRKDQNVPPSRDLNQTFNPDELQKYHIDKTQ